MDLATRFEDVRQRIFRTCTRVNRDPSEVTLIAVSKGHPPSVIAEAAQAGQALFGENKVQEARAKIPACPGRLTWHLIGHLQTNKVREAISPDGMFPEDGAKTALKALASFDVSIQADRIDLALTFTNAFARRAKQQFKA